MTSVCGVSRMCFASGMRIGRMYMRFRQADVSGEHLAAAVVAALDDALADRLKRDLHLVVVDSRAACDVIDVDVMNTGQRCDLALDASGAQAGYEFADFKRACFHGFLELVVKGPGDLP